MILCFVVITAIQSEGLVFRITETIESPHILPTFLLLRARLNVNRRNAFHDTEPCPFVGVLDVEGSIVVIRNDLARHPGRIFEPRDQITCKRLDKIIHCKALSLDLRHFLRRQQSRWWGSSKIEMLDFRSNSLHELELMLGHIIVATFDADGSLGQSCDCIGTRYLIADLDYEQVVR